MSTPLTLSLLLLASAAIAAPASPEAALQGWPPIAKATAEAMLEKYGPPAQYDENHLAWFDNGTWKRTVVHRTACLRAADRGRDFLEQAISYLVPTARIPALKSFSPRLEVAPTAGEISYCSDSEAKNRMAINLADEITVGVREPDEAADFYASTAELAVMGKSSPYLEDLRFEVDNSRVILPTGADQ